jgi:hypothetical protein
LLSIRREYSFAHAFEPSDSPGSLPVCQELNGAASRKHLGYRQIPPCFAAEMNTGRTEHLNPNSKFDRRCRFAEDIADSPGKPRKPKPARLSRSSPVCRRLPGETLDTLRRQQRGGGTTHALN